MHIITGLLLTTLLGRKAKQASQSPLLRLKWPIETKHLLPGRVRFQVPKLVGNDIEIQRINKQMKRIEGVNSIEANRISGSVVIRYQPEKLEPELLFAALIRLLGLEEELERTPPSLLTKEIQNIGKALNHALYSSTGGVIDLWTVVPLVLLGLGVRHILTQRPVTFPSGITMLWWAYAALFRGGYR